MIYYYLIRFLPNREIDKLTGFKTRNLLCIPIHSDKGIIGVTEMVNKKLVSFIVFLCWTLINKLNMEFR